jgi:predicted O-methyltransferase YrrM
MQSQASKTSSFVVEPVLTIQSRDFFPAILNGLNLLGEGVEIGVQKGYFSFLILKIWQGKKLYSIDPWREFFATEYVDVANVGQTEQEENFRETHSLLKKFGERSQIFRETSHEAVQRFTDESLDFVYLDAQHHYEAVVQDMALWWPKVKRFGILSGHDYIPDGRYEFGEFGVKRAVDEFIQTHNLQLILSCESLSEGLMKPPSWFVVKP